MHKLLERLQLFIGMVRILQSHLGRHRWNFRTRFPNNLERPFLLNKIKIALYFFITFDLLNFLISSGLFSDMVRCDSGIVSRLSQNAWLNCGSSVLKNAWTIFILCFSKGSLFASSFKSLNSKDPIKPWKALLANCYFSKAFSQIHFHFPNPSTLRLSISQALKGNQAISNHQANK